MMFKSFTALSALVASASFVSTAPTGAIVDVVFNPMITNPNAATVWQANQKQVVMWSTADIPAGEGDATGTILLGFEENNSENLNIAQPLATGFRLSAGMVEVTVPLVEERSDYIVVLFGDSGNASPQFTIKNGTQSGSSGSLSSSTSFASSVASSASGAVSSAASSASAVTSSASAASAVVSSTSALSASSSASSS